MIKSFDYSDTNVSAGSVGYLPTLTESKRGSEEIM